jgi:hypothetical protein
MGGVGPACRHDPERRREVSQATVRWALREHTSAATLARSDTIEPGGAFPCSRVPGP